MANFILKISIINTFKTSTIRQPCIMQEYFQSRGEIIDEVEGERGICKDSERKRKKERQKRKLNTKRRTF